MNADFSRVLSLLRQEMGISQRKAAAALGISPATITTYRRTICWGGASAGTAL